MIVVIHHTVITTKLTIKPTCSSNFFCSGLNFFCPSVCLSLSVCDHKNRQISIYIKALQRLLSRISLLEMVKTVFSLSLKVIPNKVSRGYTNGQDLNHIKGIHEVQDIQSRPFNHVSYTQGCGSYSQKCSFDVFQ